MNIGIVNVIDMLDMNVITYAFETYELALAQAKELENGVTYAMIHHPEETQENGMRRTVTATPEAFCVVVVSEIEMGTEILPVPL